MSINCGLKDALGLPVHKVSTTFEQYWAGYSGRETMLTDDQAERRNALLRVGATIINLFALTFALDAAVLIAQAAGVSGLGVVRDITFGFNALFAGGAIMTVILAPHFPKVVVAPVVLYIVLCLMGLPAPLDTWPEGAQTTVFAAAMALAAFATYAAIYWRLGSLVVRASDLPFKTVWLVRTIAASIVLVMGVGVMTMGGYLWGIGAVLEQQAGGYLDFTWSDVRVREDVFEKDGRRVYLVGMIHIGEPDFYARIKADMPKDALFLTEGVSDRKKLLTGGLDYRNAARVLGLEAQPAFRDPVDPQAPSPSEPAGDVEPPLPPAPQGQTFRRADVDVSEFDPRTIDLLRKIGGLYAGGDAVTFMLRFVQFATTMSPDDYEAMQQDVLKMRDAHVLMELDKVPDPYRNIVIPWGAAHLPGISEGLRTRGYVMTETRQRVVARYSTIFLHRFGSR